MAVTYVTILLLHMMGDGDLFVDAVVTSACVDRHANLEQVQLASRWISWPERGHYCVVTKDVCVAAGSTNIVA